MGAGERGDWGTAEKLGQALSRRESKEKQSVQVKKLANGARLVSLKSALNQNKEVAEPPDARKGQAFPEEHILSGGYASLRGIASLMVIVAEWHSLSAPRVAPQTNSAKSVETLGQRSAPAGKHRRVSKSKRTGFCFSQFLDEVQKISWVISLKSNDKLLIVEAE